MFWRLFGLYSVLLLAAIGLLGVVIVRRVEQHYLEQVEESLQTKAILVREMVRDRPFDETSQQLQQRTRALRPEIATRITLLADNGRVLADSDEDPARMENHANRPEVRAARESRFGSATRFSTTVNQSMMYVALRTDDPTGSVAYVRVALPLNKVEEQSAWLYRVVGGTAAITAAGALVLALWLARRVTHPIQELTVGAERIAAGEYGHKVYAIGNDEIGTLARSFNEMSQRLDAQFAQLAEDRQQLRMILSGMVEGVIALDAEQNILFTNERAAQLLGFDSKAAIGRKLWEVVRKRAVQNIVQRALSEPGPCQDELNWSGPKARTLTIHAARLPGLPPRGAMLVLHDTTELRRLERMRRDFVANVSHELKTPLAVIKVCVETLLEGAVEDPEHRGRFLNRIDEQADRLHALILDLLSLARIESGTETFDFQAVPLEAVVTTCLERHRGRAESKTQSLEAVPPANGEATEVAAWGDEEAIHQILDNLVDNALKYTPTGGRIWVRWRSADGHAYLEVEDNGIGIPEQDLPHIFERFYRVDKARSRELGGTGLGLSIVKHVVQAMHGTVSATSRLGQGTTFCVELPRVPDS
jgi:two-component system phosphate regulon sensor histidine kinase PhoR